jgi:hypothetical protein
MPAARRTKMTILSHVQKKQHALEYVPILFKSKQTKNSLAHSHRVSPVIY